MTRSTKQHASSVCALAYVSLVAFSSTSLAQNTQTFDKITLSVAVERALQYHPDALIAGAGVDAAAAAVGW